MPDLFVLTGERMGWREGSKVKWIKVVARCFAFGMNSLNRKNKGFVSLTKNTVFSSHRQKTQNVN